MSTIITEDGEIINAITYEPIARIPPFFKTPHNHDTDKESLSTALTCKDPTLTQQHLAAEADINNILARFQQTGELPVTGVAKYAQFMEEFDLQDQMVTGHDVEAAWLKLPAAVRNTLRDPHTLMRYVDHCLETGDLEPLRELGLADKIVTPEPPPAAAEAATAAAPPGGVSPAPPAANGTPSAP